jgi:hypothetical protein
MHDRVLATGQAGAAAAGTPSPEVRCVLDVLLPEAPLRREVLLQPLPPARLPGALGRLPAGGVEESRRGGDRCLEVFGEPPVASEPSKKHSTTQRGG